MSEFRWANILKLIAVILGIALVAPCAMAQTPGLNLTIELAGFPASESVEQNTYTFAQVCQAFGANLTQNHGLLGTGPFESVTCQSPDKKTATGASGKNDWVLRIRGDKKEKIFEIFWRDAQGKEISQAKYVLQTEAGPLSILAKKPTNALLAFYMTTAMPFRSTITSAMVTANKTNIKGSIGPLRQTRLPTALPLFTLTRNDDMWQATSAGSAKMAADKGGLATWKAGQLTAVDGINYYAQQTEGRRDTLHRVDQLIQSDVDSFAGRFLAMGRSGYAGVRYGVPTVGESVLKKAKLIGIFGEFRSGVVAGLKLNYDITPAQNYTDSLGTTKYSWSRFQMGYGFSKALANKLFNWIDATPRIGFTTLELHYTPADETTTPYDFKLSKAPTIGLEIGAESRTNYFIARLWAFGSLSVPIIPIDHNNSTNSLRAGLDFYRELLSFRDTKLAGLIFGAIDSTSVSKKLSAAEIDESQAKNIRNNSLFVGGGTIFTW